jgi:hypothetical protein
VKLIEEDFFPTIVDGLLGVLVIFVVEFVQGSQGGDELIKIEGLCSMHTDMCAIPQHRAT